MKKPRSVEGGSKRAESRVPMFSRDNRKSNGTVSDADALRVLLRNIKGIKPTKPDGVKELSKRFVPIAEDSQRSNTLRTTFFKAIPSAVPERGILVGRYVQRGAFQPMSGQY